MRMRAFTFREGSIATMRFDGNIQQNEVLTRARRATAVFFFTNGAVIANLLPRLPEIKNTYHLSDDIYGLTVASLPAGAIAAGLTAGWFTRRFGSARVATVGTLLTAGALILASTMPMAALFAVLLAVAGATDAVTDVAQNTHGLEVQRRYQRSIINSFHAVWSIGAVSGGLMSAAAVGLGLSLPWHLFLSGAICALLVLWAQGDCLPAASAQAEAPGDQRAEDTPVQTVSAGQNSASMSKKNKPATGGCTDQSDAPSSRKNKPATGGYIDQSDAPSSEKPRQPAGGPRKVPRGHLLPTHLTLVALVLIATAGAMVEDMANSWATLYLGRDLHAATQIAVLGFPTIVGAQFIGRLAGDPMVNRWGYRNVARFGATLIALGVGSAIAWPTIPVTLAGFAAAGFGSATLVPAAMHAADNLPHLRPGTGLTVVSWLMRLGFMLTAPTVGAIAAATSLRWGLSVVAVAGAVTVALAAVLPGLVKPADVLSSKHD